MNEMPLFQPEWKPLDLLTFNPSIYYSCYSSFDLNLGMQNGRSGLEYNHGYPIRNSAGGWSPMATLTGEPLDGWRIYGKTGSNLHSPSSFESLKGFSFTYFGDAVTVSPERNNSYEIGTRYLTRTGVPKQLLPGYYYEYLTLVNLDYAKMSGIEITAVYDTGKSFGGSSWSHYIETIYCAKDGTPLAKRTQCAEGELYNSYTLQQIPPKDTVTVNLGIRFFDEKLTLGSHIMYVGKGMVEGNSDGSEDTYMGGQLHTSKYPLRHYRSLYELQTQRSYEVQCQYR